MGNQIEGTALQEHGFIIDDNKVELNTTYMTRDGADLTEQVKENPELARDRDAIEYLIVVETIEIEIEPNGEGGIDITITRTIYVEYCIILLE